MDGHSGQMMVDMSVAYQEMGITEQQLLQQQQEHQQFNGNDMPDGSMQLATFFAVEEQAMAQQQQQQWDLVALQQQQQQLLHQNQQYEAAMAHNTSLAVDMGMSHQSGADLTQQSYLTPLNQEGLPDDNFHFADPQAAAAAAAQMEANGMGQVRMPASMVAPHACQWVAGNDLLRIFSLDLDRASIRKDQRQGLSNQALFTRRSNSRGRLLLRSLRRATDVRAHSWPSVPSDQPDGHMPSVKPAV
ncbi:hypothetical protein AC579_9753 [Pseudocercospora musae]|uniref:Uncharacterized protein n=1 Tax=Pseudocercospora musae TaxID=113226 RepID=A0A139I652_9PEZI|nr:hypothetical protein AC579_9753 [Pseudocercospora musae]